LSIAFSLLLVCIVLASGLAIHDGRAGQSLIETIVAITFAFVAFSARAIDVNLAVRSTRGLKAVAVIPAICMVIQLLPTPFGAHSLWAYANEALGRQSWGHISIDPGSTLLTLTFYLASISLILVCLFATRDRRRAELLLFTLAYITGITTFGLLLGKLGLIGAFISDEALSAISTLGILLSLASIARAIERYEHASTRTEPANNFLTALITSCIGLVVNLAGLGMSATLNAGLAALLGVLTLASLQIIRRADLASWAARILIATLIIAATMVVVGRYDTTRTLSPLLQFASASSPEELSTAQRMLSDNRWLGTGAGTFDAVLPIYQDLGSSIAKPPSTASGLAIEFGLPITLVMIVIAIWLAVTLYRAALYRGRDSFYPAVAAAAIIAILAQAFCDASLMNSGIAIVLAALTGLGLAQSVSGRDNA